MENISEKVKIEQPYIRFFLGELLGTFILVFIGNGASHAAALDPTLSSLHQPLAYGLGCALGIFSCAGVCGGHINPAITVAHVILGKLGSTWRSNLSAALVIVSGQFLGGFVASGVVHAIYIDTEHYLNGENATSLVGMYATWPGAPFPISIGRLFADQFFTTAILAITVLAVTDPHNARPKGMAPLIIGLAVAALALGYGANGGGAFNPARDFGPRLVALFVFGSEAFSGFSYFFWIPLVAPLLGGAHGALVYFFFISAHWPLVENC